MNSKKYDAVIVGSGPNGFAAAITLAQAGKSTLILEAQDKIGGGAGSSELILPGCIHDTCSAVHPMGISSPFFRKLPLEKFGLEWIHPDVPLAHPLDGQTPVLLDRSLEKTSENLGKRDGKAYRELMEGFVNSWQNLFEDALAPPGFPHHPLLMANFGFWGLRSAKGLADSLFKDPQARALVAGLAGHSLLPLDQAPSAAIGMMLTVAAHSVGWPFPRGGSQKLSDALAGYYKSLGGEIKTGVPVRSPRDLPESQVVLFDLTSKNFLNTFKSDLPSSYQDQLEMVTNGPGLFKMDWVLSQPIPWKDADCARAGTVHLGGTFEEIQASEQLTFEGKISDRPFVLLSQPSLFDPSRAPAGKHIVWAYCHVPIHSKMDMTSRIEDQIERFAPGFKDCILAKTASFPKDLEKRNSNYLGGDISGGLPNLRQFLFRPVFKMNPYKVPVSGWYLCSASTPPGPGVHGMCGYFAAQSALKKIS